MEKLVLCVLDDGSISEYRLAKETDRDPSKLLKGCRGKVIVVNYEEIRDVVREIEADKTGERFLKALETINEMFPIKRRSSDSERWKR